MVAQSDLRRIGYVETVLVNPGNMRITAKIDTGAKSSSLDVLNVRPFVRDGKQWVRFVLTAEDGKRRRFELPVTRIATIKRAGVSPQRRFVVKMGICLGDVYEESDVNLVNRQRMNYRMLVGRLFTAGRFVVDPEATFLTRPACRTP